MKMKLPVIRRKKKAKKGYDYKNDVNWSGCKHKRTTPFEVKPEWQEDTVSIVMECKDCTRIGMVDGTVKYDNEEIEWYDD